MKAKITNEEECKKYVDVECKADYYIESSDILNKISDKIVIAYSKGYSYEVSHIFVYAKNNTIYAIKINN